MCETCGCSPCVNCGGAIEDGVCSGCGMPPSECECSGEEGADE